MTNEDKEEHIRQWIDMDERVMVHVLDAPDPNATWKPPLKASKDGVRNGT